MNVHGELVCDSDAEYFKQRHSLNEYPGDIRKVEIGTVEIGMVIASQI